MSELENKWREIVKEWQSSGETQRAYSRGSGHSSSQLSYWSRKLEQLDERKSIGKGPKSQPSFVELLPNPVESKSIDSVVELEFISGLVLRIRW